MPGPYIHISAMRHAAADLAEERYFPQGSDEINPEWEGIDTLQLGKILKQHANFASLGAIGPDLFFFLPDFRDITVLGAKVSTSSVLVKVLEFLEETYKALDPYISQWEKYLGPIGQDTEEEISRLTGGLSEAINNVVGELNGILTTLLEDFVVKQHDWWEFFSLGLDKGYDEQAYFWSDMLHYRETGKFARALLDYAASLKGDEADQVEAYSLGYMTHLATDVTGHAFVNAISGGPFRLHWQRHHLVENHMDTFWYLNDALSSKSGDLYPQLTESALYFDIAFGSNGQPVSRPGYSTGQTLREKWQRRRKLDLDSQLPQPVADALIYAMKQVFYQDGKHPMILQDNEGRPSAQLIQDAYDLFFRYLKLVTVDGFSHEPPDPPQIFGNLDFPTPSDPHEDPPDEGDTGGKGSIWDDILNFILSVINAIAYVFEVALWLATLPWALVADVVTFPIRLALYYALELPLFHLLKMFRNVLVMSGYVLPQKDEIASGLIHINWADQDTFKQILRTIDDIFGGTQDVLPGTGKDKYRDPVYPHLHPEKEYLHPWKYPADADVELPATIAGPFASGANPSVLFGNRGQDASIRDRLQDAQTPQDADAVDCELTPDRHLGDCISFSKYLIWLESRFKQQKAEKTVPLIEWNLDADRGYGYHCWDWNRDAHGTEQKDPEGNKFPPPCAWPPQADSGFNPKTPLKIHWMGKDAEGQELPDPGCAAPDPQNPSDPCGPPPIG